MKRIALFAKRPLTGRVKTRLSPALPPEQACKLYTALLEDTIDELAAARADALMLWWAEGEPVDAHVALPGGWKEATQRGADLGARMADAFQALLADGARAVIVGADCPALSARHVDAAFRALEQHDVVFGPAGDGGYYLVGLCRPHASLFESVPWGTSTVLAESLARAKSAALQIHLLEPLDDLDTPADLVRWIARVATGQDGRALRVRAVLKRLGLAPSA